jgi:hypothetical protein
MNEHERVEELLAADALGGLSSPDQAELEQAWEEHGRTCESCRRARAEFSEVAGRLAFSLAPAAVPSDMADRVLRLVGEPVDEKRAPEREEPGEGARVIRPVRWSRGLVAVAAAVTLLAVGGLGGFLLSGQDEGETALAAFLAEPGTRVAEFEGMGASGLKVAYRPGEDQSYVFGSDVAAAPAGTVYKLWLVPGTGAPVPGPAFSPGDGLLIVEVPSDPSEAGTMALTFETDPDVAQPTPPIASTAATPA